MTSPDNTNLGSELTPENSPDKKRPEMSHTAGRTIVSIWLAVFTGHLRRLLAYATDDETWLAGT